MTTGKSLEETAKADKQRVEELRRELHQAELAEAVGNVAAVMHQVAATEQGSEPKLGPTVFAEVAVNGVPTRALIDTGSPATIISLDFAMRVLTQGRKEGQTPLHWKEETLKKFSPPEVTLKSYGEQQLRVIAQTPLCLSQEASTEAMVLVQKGAPNNLLLGTDVQPQLGFAMVVRKTGGVVDLFSGREWECVDGEKAQLETSTGQAESSVVGLSGSGGGAGGRGTDSVPNENIHLECTSDGGATVGVVRLLQTTKIPAGYGKMVRARVDGEIAGALLLFTPSAVEGGVKLADGMVEVGDGPCVTLVVENHGRETLRLEGGVELGSVAVVEVAGVGGPNGSESGADANLLETACVCHLATAGDLAESRTEKLLSQSNLQYDGLTLSQQQQLEEFLLSYQDIFALDSSELGATQVVSHSIDTGDHPPIKQPVRRVPFALRSKVDELVKSLLAQGVIVPSKSPWASPIVLVRKMGICVSVWTTGS